MSTKDLAGNVFAVGVACNVVLKGSGAKDQVWSVRSDSYSHKMTKM